MNKIELVVRILFFGLLIFGEIALAIIGYLATKITMAIRSLIQQVFTTIDLVNKN